MGGTKLVASGPGLQIGIQTHPKLSSRIGPRNPRNTRAEAFGQASYSLGEEAMTDFVDRKTSCQKTTPMDELNLPFLNKALVAIKPNYNRLKNAWRSLLVTRGTFVKRKAPFGNEQGYIVSVNEWGISLLPMEQEVIGGKRTFCFKQPLVLEHVILDMWDEWWVLELVHTPPAYQHEAFAALTEPKGICFLLGKAGDLKKHAADACCPNCSVAHLKAFARDLKIVYGVRRRPTTEYEYCTWTVAIVKGIDVGNEELLEPILSKMKFESKSRFATIFNSECVDLADGVLNPDDTKEVRTQVARAILEKKQLASSASGTKGKSKCAAAPSAPRILELQGGAIVDVAWMRKYLPITTGCTLTKNVTFHMSFIGKYPTPVAPHMLSSV